MAAYTLTIEYDANDFFGSPRWLVWIDFKDGGKDWREFETRERAEAFIARYREQH